MYRLLIVLMIMGSCKPDTNQAMRKEINNRGASNSLMLVRPYKEEINIEFSVVNGSGKTTEEGIISEVVIVESMKDFEHYNKENLQGKIVLVNNPRDVIRIVNLSAKHGAVGCLFTSNKSSNVKTVLENMKNPIPVLYINRADYDLIKGYHKEALVQMFIKIK